MGVLPVEKQGKNPVTVIALLETPKMPLSGANVSLQVYKARHPALNHVCTISLV